MGCSEMVASYSSLRVGILGKERRSLTREGFEGEIMVPTAMATGERNGFQCLLAHMLGRLGWVSFSTKAVDFFSPGFFRPSHQTSLIAKIILHFNLKPTLLSL
jgi:hypothetical protein